MDTNEKKQFFSEHLLAWYRKHRRDLPWRRSRNPYHIWISEVMLQQTRVDTVIPYFHRFTERFPTMEALANAPEEEVLKLWEGLGYYSRARNLQGAVREVQERYGGVVPDTLKEISTLKGVGPYTAGAVLSIAYNKPEPAVDGNVMRVLSRYFLIEEDIMKIGTRGIMEKLAKELIPEGAAGDFNQGLMELGAMVCTPRSPHCLTCPVMEHCAAREMGMEEELPVKKKAKPPRPEYRIAALIEGSGPQEGHILIRQRPQEGLLARMWELPHVEVPFGYADASGVPASISVLTEQLALETIGIRPGQGFMHAEHTFSHIHWDMQVVTCSLEPSVVPSGTGMLLPSHYQWVNRDTMEQYAFPNVFLKILKRYFSL
ncbi:A/G-specific adenine glycosylase [Paenibacillus doosanensis]|uniref:Adenine DNA glycosylase n=1 Tax=Paenibacillus konkukensis TaxID=2020716 RepID=A0ABY4RPH3_9BACL|nr:MULTISPECIES: A/G-specific adenine glycosylase [Paenibacillus]MCS7464666.1 A/G-specific adenine glycosylase [Paenibacillus doosanensis]UQZ84068.1 putative A/G-specific adenine glycosylase YfhQ [Paenibacillus konkukensis]